MKKKKEFFRIRKSKKRKNGANARAYVRIHIDRTARRFSANRGRARPTTEKSPLTVFEPKDKPTDREALVLFSKHNRPCLVF